MKSPWWRCGVVVITTAQLHSTKPELRSCADSNPAHGVSEIRDGEDLWQWSWLEIRLNAFRRSTIPQKQFIIIMKTNPEKFIVKNYLVSNSIVNLISTFIWKQLLKTPVRRYMFWLKLCLHCVKYVQIRSYFWSVFSCIWAEYRKILTRNNSLFGHFWRSDIFISKRVINECFFQSSI